MKEIVIYKDQLLEYIIKDDSSITVYQIPNEIQIDFFGARDELLITFEEVELNFEQRRPFYIVTCYKK